MRKAAHLAGLLLLAAAVAGAGARWATADDPPPGMEAPAMGGGDEADGPVPFVDAVNRAIDRGGAWLSLRQRDDGSWGPVTPAIAYDPTNTGRLYDYPAGSAALAAYTLLKCGVPSTDPVVKRAFDSLRKRRLPASSYEASMSLLAVTATADPFKRVKASAAAGDRVKLTGDLRKWAQELADHLVGKRAPQAWRYNRPNAPIEPGGDQDLSSTQLAALALLAADRCGVKVDGEVWSGMAAFAMAQQEREGPEHPRAVRPRGMPPPPGGTGASDAVPKDRARGFAYIASDALEPDDGRATGGMTACGVGVLATARYVLEERGDRAWKRRDPAPLLASVHDGVAWLDLHWSAFENPGKTKFNLYHVYYLYCVERAMDLLGNRLLGAHDWYVEMGRSLLDRQDADGRWDSDSTHEPSEVLDTCFALLFLKRATRGGIPHAETTPDEPVPGPTGK